MKPEDERLASLPPQPVQTGETIETSMDDFIDRLSTYLESRGYDTTNWDGDDPAHIIVGRAIADLLDALRKRAEDADQKAKSAALSADLEAKGKDELATQLSAITTALDAAGVPAQSANIVGESSFSDIPLDQRVAWLVKEWAGLLGANAANRVCKSEIERLQNIINSVHYLLDQDESKIVRNTKDSYPTQLDARDLTLTERVKALCRYAHVYKTWFEEAEAKLDASPWIACSTPPSDEDLDFNGEVLLLWDGLSVTRGVFPEPPSKRIIAWRTSGVAIPPLPTPPAEAKGKQRTELTAEEKDILRELAEKSGLSIRDYLRAVVALKVGPENPELAAKIASGIKPSNLPQSQPWTLPSPPAGMQWHRQDWTQDMLPEGWRPLLLGEGPTPDDQMLSNPSPAQWSYLTTNVPATTNMRHTRTRRSLPLPAPVRMVAWDSIEDLPKVGALWIRGKGDYRAHLLIGTANTYMITATCGCQPKLESSNFHDYPWDKMEWSSDRSTWSNCEKPVNVAP